MPPIDELPVVTCGVVYIHSTPSALCPHIEWALSATLGVTAHLKWSSQPALPGTLRASVDWVGPVGTGIRFAMALRQWSLVRFEVTEDPSDGIDGERFCHVPGLGFWRGSISANGDVILSELRLRHLISEYGDKGLCDALEAEMGTAYDQALEPFRRGGEGAEVTWLHQRVS